MFQPLNTNLNMLNIHFLLLYLASIMGSSEGTVWKHYNCIRFILFLFFIATSTKISIGPCSCSTGQFHGSNIFEWHGLTFRIGSDGSAVALLRWADLRPGLVHGPASCGPHEVPGREGEDGPFHHPSTLIRSLYNVWPSFTHGRRESCVPGRRRPRHQFLSTVWVISNNHEKHDAIGGSWSHRSLPRIYARLCFNRLHNNSRTLVQNV